MSRQCLKLELLKTNHDSSLQHKLIAILINVYVTYLGTFSKQA